MEMNKVIDIILSELEYRSDEGIVDFTNKKQLSIMSEIMDELGLEDIKSELITNLTEGTDFKDPVLNKTIKYRNDDGEEVENKVGNLLRLADDDPGRQAANKYLPKDPSDKEEVMKNLGNENQPTRKDEPSADTAPDGDEEGDEFAEPELGTAFQGDSGEHYIDTLPPEDPARIIQTGEKPKEKDSEKN